MTKEIVRPGSPAESGCSLADLWREPDWGLLNFHLAPFENRRFENHWGLIGVVPPALPAGRTFLVTAGNAPTGSNEHLARKASLVRNPPSQYPMSSRRAAATPPLLSKKITTTPCNELSELWVASRYRSAKIASANRAFAAAIF